MPPWKPGSLPKVAISTKSTSRQVSGSHPTSPDGTMEDVGALPDLPNDLPVAEVQKEEDGDSFSCSWLYDSYPGVHPQEGSLKNPCACDNNSS